MPDIKFWFRKPLFHTTFEVEEAPDCFHNHVEYDGDEEVEDEEPVHFLAQFGLHTGSVIIEDPKYSDEQQSWQEEQGSQHQSYVQIIGGAVLSNLQKIQCLWLIGHK